METISIRINDKEYQARPDQSILDVVNEHNIDEIPTLCHSPELEPYGSCFVCVVEVAGRRNLVPSCATRVAPGMEVQTKNDRVKSSRRAALELIISNHYADCVSPCTLGCPAHVDVQGYIALTAMGLYHQAVDLIRKTNPFPTICGRVCVRKCEIVCRRKEIDEAVGINNIKRYLTDMPGIYNQVPPRALASGKKVAIVGGGPSGFTAAYYLGLAGHEIEIFEALPQTGGMLRYGIPEYRLPGAVLDREIDYILRASGAKLHLNARVGETISLDHLRRDFDAVYLAAGASGSNQMRVAGEDDTPGVVLGVDYLQEKTEKPTKVDGTVVVIGGGNTAMDAARVSWRLGAEKVILLYRRTKAEMPADPMEVQACIDEGIEIIELAAPVAIVKNDDGSLKALRCTRMILGEPDASGRRRPIPQEGSEFDLPCDMAITAIGQKPILQGLTESEGVAIDQTRWSTLVTDGKSMACNIPGFFAGGDVADDGPTVVIDAIADGGKAARGIHDYLTGEQLPTMRLTVRKEIFGKPTRNELGNIAESPRHEIAELEVEERRSNFKEVATGFEDEDATHECNRCLSCGCFAATECLLRKYADDYNIDMENFIGYTRKQRVDDNHPYLIYDPNKCILCARCIRTCSKVLNISALGLVNRGFKTEMRPAMNEPLVRTNCVSCGNCVDSCPTGALTIKLPFPGRCDLPVVKSESKCGYCSLACTIVSKKYSDRHYFIRSSEEPGEYICRFGRFGNELFIRQPRLEKPLIRQNGRLEDSDWSTVESHIVESLQAIAAKYGPESVAVFASPELTNEELYLAGRISRQAIGTNNIVSLALATCGAELYGLDSSLGFTGSTADRSAIENADLIICNNTDLERDNLILSIAVIKALQSGQAKMIGCTSAENSLGKMADLALDPIRGRSGLLWNSVLQMLLEEGFFVRDQVAQLPGGQEFLQDTFNYNAEALQAKTGVEKEKIAKAAAMLRQAKRVVLIYSLDRTVDRSPGDLAMMANLLTLLRQRGVVCDLLLPTSYANLAGASLLGIDPSRSAGHAPIPNGIPGARSCQDLGEMVSEGRLKGALVIGEDPMRDGKISSYLRSVEFLATVDTGYTETVNFSDAVLPGSTYLETAGTRCNFEGKLAQFHKIIEPPASKDGFAVLRDLARAFGLADVPETATMAQEEIAQLLAEKIPDLLPYLWSKNSRKAWDGQGRLVVASTETKTSKAAPPVTRMADYKQKSHTVDTEHFKVH